MTIEVLTQPAYEPVSLAQAREWLRLESDDTANTAVLQLLIAAMREDAENLTHRAFVSRQLRLNLEAWPSCHTYGSRIELPYAPLISVDSFKYINTEGVLTTLATDQYSVHDEAEPAFVIPAYQVTWPTIRQVPNAIQITFTAGYAVGSPPDEAAAQENVPRVLKLWMETKLATLFENREQIISGATVAKVPRDFTDGLLDSITVGTRLF